MANMPTTSKRLVAAYVLDWIIIILIAAIGAGINYVEPYKRPFSLMDLSISYPKVEESIPIGLLTVIVLVIPAIIIFVIVLALVPGPRFTRGLSRKTMITRKLWEWEKGWAGLALALVCAFFITQGMKNLFGRPRPSSIARCEPDLNNLQNYVVGGYGQNLDPRWVLVSGDICQNPDAHLVNDAFKSFPSGHASFSWAGLLYLSFFLCSKFAIQIPYLPSQSPTQEHTGNRSSAQELLPLHHNGEPVEGRKPRDSDVTAADFTRTVPARNQAASPPNHLIIVAFIPVAVAVYICSTRFVEFYHFGTDLIAGSVIGILSAWFAFRWYHLPVGKGAGWAWGPRSKERAFGIGVGVGNYADADNWTSSASRQRQRAPGVAKYANGADYHQPGSATTANFSNGVEYPPPGHVDTSYSNGAHSYARGNDASEYAHAEDWPSSSRLDQRGNERVPV